MAGEAHVLAYGNPPRRHKAHRDNLQFGDEDGSGFILRARGASGVKDSRRGRAEPDLIMQNKANFQKREFAIMALQAKGYVGSARGGGRAKRSQFAGPVPIPGVRATTGGCPYRRIPVALAVTRS
jgi:hypothetical protein